MSSPHHHARRHLHQPHQLGARAADWLSAKVGSWPFVLGFLGLVLLWIVWNILSPLVFDPPPFIGLNLGLSLLAGIQAPVILMSQNRAAAKDAARDDVEAEEVDSLVKMNTRQLEILEILHQLQRDARGSL